MKGHNSWRGAGDERVKKSNEGVPLTFRRHNITRHLAYHNKRRQGQTSHDGTRGDLLRHYHLYLEGEWESPKHGAQNRGPKT